MGKYRDSSLFFIPDDPEQVFNGLTTGHDYVVGRDQGMVVAGAVSFAQVQAMRKAYPGKIPMEATRGWSYLVHGFLHHEMSTDLEVRRNNWQEAQRVYCGMLRGDVRVVADFAAEPAGGFLRRELMPLLLMERPDAVTSVNHMTPADFMHWAGWDKEGSNNPPRRAQIFQFRRPAASPA